VLGQRTEDEDPEDVSTTYSFDTRGFVRQRSSPDAGTRAAPQILPIFSGRLCWLRILTPTGTAASPQ
jgi:hypothetical protein